MYLLRGARCDLEGRVDKRCNFQLKPFLFRKKRKLGDRLDEVKKYLSELERA